MLKNGTYEYQMEGYQGENDTTFINRGLHDMKKLDEHATAQDRLHNLPLSNVWVAWYEQSKLNDFEMSAVLRFLNHKSYPFGQYEELVPYIKQFYPDLTGLNINSEENYYTKIRTYITIIRRLFIVYADRETIVSYKLDVFEDMVASFPKRLQNYKFQLSGYHHSITANWANIITSYAGDLSVGEINLLSNEDLKRFWDIQMYLVAQDFGHPDTVTDIQEITQEKRNSGNLNFPDVEVTLRLYKAGLINDDDLLFQALYSNDLMTIIDGGYNYRIRRGTLTEKFGS